jgi:hypothetical protein
LGTLSPERARVVAALQNATARTGLKSAEQSAKSSATGLFQFIDQTWLGLVKDHGASHGLGAKANAITKGADGRYHAKSDKEAILALRKDPTAAALMAGEYAKSTSASMSAALGCPVCGGELYAAHFLGPDAACKLIKLAQNDPKASAAVQFPAAAAANKSVFFHADGSAKSAREVYDWMLCQPGGADTVRSAPAPTLPQSPMVMAVTAPDSEIQMLISNVMNWQPHGFFGGGANSSLNSGFNTGAGALSFGPGLLNLLSDARES